MGAKAMSSHGSGAGGGGALPRQGSVCSLTFSEVDGQQLHCVNVQGGCPCPRAQMTLEDFLCRTADAGARGWGHQQPELEPEPARPDHRSHTAGVVGRPVPRPLGVGAGPVLDALYHESAGLTKRAAAGGGVAERSNERRKKRMIKNRESAARSRARKQAYTNELENKIARLEEENEQLRSHKALEPEVQYVPQLELKNQLRRTNSANF